MTKIKYEINGNNQFVSEVVVFHPKISNNTIFVQRKNISFENHIL